jgi:GNAT superfamily N-acetyltransferase
LKLFFQLINYIRFMLIRPAVIPDIPALHDVRCAVQENRLNTPSLVTPEHYTHYLTVAGKGWLCEVQGRVAGFAIVDAVEKMVWALFVHPNFEGKGIGRRLQAVMLDWYFAQDDTPLWLSTAPGTRAERFYKAFGWRMDGFTSQGEVRFEMSAASWLNVRQEW